jgi:hypothetical protein
MLQASLSDTTLSIKLFVQIFCMQQAVCESCLDVLSDNFLIKMIDPWYVDVKSRTLSVFPLSWKTPLTSLGQLAKLFD